MSSFKKIEVNTCEKKERKRKKKEKIEKKMEERKCGKNKVLLFSCNELNQDCPNQGSLS